MAQARPGCTASPSRPRIGPADLYLSRIPRALRMVVYTTVFLGVVVGLLPWGAHGAARAALSWHIEIGIGRGFGWVLFLASLAGYLGSTLWLVRNARGANVEFDPPRQLVSSGPYGRSRNPIALCVVLMLLGLALAQSSVGIFVLFLLSLPVAHAQVVVLEEPLLRRRFEAAYERYAEEVPRWVPRLRRKDRP